MCPSTSTRAQGTPSSTTRTGSGPMTRSSPRPPGGAPWSSCATRSPEEAHRAEGPDRKRCARMDRDYELQTHQAEDRHWWYRGRRTVIERVVSDLRLPARARILDAGCGSGRNMVELARHGTVTGVELSPTSVCLAREREAGEVVEGSVL